MAQTQPAPGSRVTPETARSGPFHPAHSMALPDEPKKRNDRMARRASVIAVMKYLLPTVAVAVILLVVIWPQLQPRVDRFRMGLAALHDSSKDEPTLINARYEGIDREGRPFLITADEVVDVATDKDKVSLLTPHADLTLEGGGWMSLTAVSGIYDKKSSLLDLAEDVSLFHEDGYQVTTAKATIDLDAGTASGTSPVEGQSPFGNLTSEGFRIIDEGRTVFFDGRARMTIYPSALPPQE